MSNSDKYQVWLRDRSKRIRIIERDLTKKDADQRIRNIAQAQKDIGAYWATPRHESFGIASAVWRDGSYIEVWREFAG